MDRHEFRIGNTRPRADLLDDAISGSDIEVYCETMTRLAQLPARVVHAGHDPSFDGRRPTELACDYLKRRA